MNKEQLGGRIAASMMCADYLDLKACLDDLAANGIEYLHLDVMDGSFVPNYTLGPCIVEQLRKYSRIPFDFHLMVERPEDKLGFFDIRPGDLVSVHAEATCHLQRLLQRIRDMGARPGVAINPATPLSAVEEVLWDVDFILVMTVNPGFAGQKIVPSCMRKVERLRKLLRENGLDHVMIQVDGNINTETARSLRQGGADIFVAGTSGLFRNDKPMKELVAALRQSIE